MRTRYGKDNPAYKHGFCKTKEYNRLRSIFSMMKARCYNPNCRNYYNYGGRGIKIRDEWLENFINFHNWAISNGYKLGLQIDRIDVNGNYEPNNCRWVNAKQQANNKRNNHHLTYKGETHSMMEWAEILNVNYNTLRGRITHSNWSVERAFETPYNKDYEGELKKCSAKRKESKC